LKAKEDAKKEEEEKMIPKKMSQFLLTLKLIRILNLLKNLVNRPKEF